MRGADPLGDANGGSGLASQPVTLKVASGQIVGPNGVASTYVLNRDYQDALLVSSSGEWDLHETHPPTRVTATLSSGSVTVSNALISTATPPFATHNATSTGNEGALFTSAITSGTSVTIKSTNAADTDGITLTIP